MKKGSEILYPAGLTLNSESVIQILTGFIEDCIHKTSVKKGIIGLSGGIDSSVSAALAVQALGADRVLGLIMPYKSSSSSSAADAEEFAGKLGISTEHFDISPMVDSFYNQDPGVDENRRGNTMARQRMSVLYDISARETGLVIGTSNKSEMLLGYGTIFGDLACAINPMGDLYKTQVRQLAEVLDIPDSIRNKAPTADLVTGQTDESDFGFTYDEVDKFLYLWVDQRYNEAELEDYGFDPAFISKVIKLVRRNHFKRIPPLIAKVSGRTIGHEFRYAWDWSNV